MPLNSDCCNIESLQVVFLDRIVENRSCLRDIVIHVAEERVEHHRNRRRKLRPIVVERDVIAAKRNVHRTDKLQVASVYRRASLLSRNYELIVVYDNFPSESCCLIRAKDN